MADVPPYPLYNSTFSLYRISPLYTGDTSLLEPPSLRTHSRRLRDLLKGDNLRGVQVDFAGAESSVNNRGPLEECHWSLLGDEDSWVDSQSQANDPESSHVSSTVSSNTARGIQIDLHYAKYVDNAYLLRDPDRTVSISNFTIFPLLMVKMPVPIRDIVLDYLATTFDTQISSMKLLPEFMTSVLESHMAYFTAESPSQSIPDIIKQVGLQLTFPTGTALLKNLDISIAREDIPGFLARGKQLSSSSNETQPFTAALAVYLKSHLALDFSNEKVHISKITCGTFALGSEGRVKLFPPQTLSPDTSLNSISSEEISAAQSAMQECYKMLIKEATRSSNFIPKELKDGVEQSNGSDAQKRGLKTMVTNTRFSKRSQEGAKSRGRTAASANNRPADMQTPGALGIGGIPAEPPPPYELHDPSFVST